MKPLVLGIELHKLTAKKGCKMQPNAPKQKRKSEASMTGMLVQPISLHNGHMRVETESIWANYGTHKCDTHLRSMKKSRYNPRRSKMPRRSCIRTHGRKIAAKKWVG